MAGDQSGRGQTDLTRYKILSKIFKFYKLFYYYVWIFLQNLHIILLLV